MLNKTHAEHSVIAVVIQLCLWPAFGLWAAGSISIAVLLGREIAQHEYKLAIDLGWSWGEVKPVKWHEGIVKGWSNDSILDLIVPALVCLFVVGLANIFLQVS
jgi:hypothetical protein